MFTWKRLRVHILRLGHRLGLTWSFVIHCQQQQQQQQRGSGRALMTHLRTGAFSPTTSVSMHVVQTSRRRRCGCGRALALTTCRDVECTCGYVRGSKLQLTGDQVCFEKQENRERIYIHTKCEAKTFLNPSLPFVFHGSGRRPRPQNQSCTINSGGVDGVTQLLIVHRAT